MGIARYSPISGKMESGIEFFYPRTYEQNDTAERKHRHTVKIGLALLAHSSVPIKFWNHAFEAAVYLINRLPTPNLGSTSPSERLFAKAPDYSLLRTFGCACYPLLRPYNSHKLQYRLVQCIFLGSTAPCIVATNVSISSTIKSLSPVMSFFMRI